MLVGIIVGGIILVEAYVKATLSVGNAHMLAVALTLHGYGQGRRYASMTPKSENRERFSGPRGSRPLPSLSGIGEL